jgi:hypothetical protein
MRKGPNEARIDLIGSPLGHYSAIFAHGGAGVEEKLLIEGAGLIIR